MAIIKTLVFFVVYGICALLGYYLISKTRVRNGKKWVKFVSLCIFAGMVIALVGSGALRDYQKNRLLAFANPEFDPQGAGYHIIQSKIAIGFSARASWSPATVASISCITLKASTLNVPVTTGFTEF